MNQTPATSPLQQLCVRLDPLGTRGYEVRLQSQLATMVVHPDMMAKLSDVASWIERGLITSEALSGWEHEAELVPLSKEHTERAMADEQRFYGYAQQLVTLVLDKPPELLLGALQAFPRTGPWPDDVSAFALELLHHPGLFAPDATQRRQSLVDLTQAHAIFCADPAAGTHLLATLDTLQDALWNSHVTVAERLDAFAALASDLTPPPSLRDLSLLSAEDIQAILTDLPSLRDEDSYPSLKGACLLDRLVAARHQRREAWFTEIQAEFAPHLTPAEQETLAARLPLLVPTIASAESLSGVLAADRAEAGDTYDAAGVAQFLLHLPPDLLLTTIRQREANFKPPHGPLAALGHVLAAAQLKPYQDDQLRLHLQLMRRRPATYPALVADMTPERMGEWLRDDPERLATLLEKQQVEYDPRHGNPPSVLQRLAMDMAQANGVKPIPLESLFLLPRPQLLDLCRLAARASMESMPPGNYKPMLESAFKTLTAQQPPELRPAILRTGRA